MREIKFRAWDSVAKTFLSAFQIDQDGLMSYELMKVDGIPVIPTSVGGRFKIMQFTGVKDKNGKEIYEGDILEIDPVLNRHSEADENLPDITDHVIIRGDVQWGEVKWKLDTYNKFTQQVIKKHKGYWIPNNDLYRLIWCKYHVFEVIGNIYENPELLEYKKDG